MQGLHEVAFTGALAKPLIAPEAVIPSLSADALAVCRPSPASLPILAHVFLPSLPLVVLGGWGGRVQRYLPDSLTCFQ